MKTLLEFMKMAFRIATAALFGLAVLFWVVVVYFTSRGFITGGSAGVQGWFLHIGARRSADSVVPVTPSWEAMVLRLGGMAVITLLLWLANRRVLNQVGHELRDWIASLRNPPDAPRTHHSS